MPRISANKLAEFLITQNPVRRRRILSDQKYPSDVVAPLYRRAMDPITRFLQSRGGDVDVMHRAIERLRADESGTTWDQNDRRNTAIALEHVLEIRNQLPMAAGFSYLRGPVQPPKLSFRGVDISIRPDLLLHFERRGRPLSGAIKFHFTKNEESSLQRSGSEYVASLLHRWLATHTPADRAPHYDFCFSVDVFRQTVITAPRSSVRRLTEVDAACEEIAARWHSI